MFPSLQAVHEVLGVDVDVGVEHVEPLRQVLLHGVQVLVGPGEGSEVPAVHQLIPIATSHFDAHSFLADSTHSLNFLRIFFTIYFESISDRF